jgi:hypothetical protein
MAGTKRHRRYSIVITHMPLQVERDQTTRRKWYIGPCISVEFQTWNKMKGPLCTLILHQTHSFGCRTFHHTCGLPAFSNLAAVHVCIRYCKLVKYVILSGTKPHCIVVRPCLPFLGKKLVCPILRYPRIWRTTLLELLPSRISDQ